MLSTLHAPTDSVEHSCRSSYFLRPPEGVCSSSLLRLFVQVCMHRWSDAVSRMLTSILQVFCLYTPFHCQTLVPSQLLHTEFGHVCENPENK
ncbi:histone deacetylase 10 isoform X2 [Iris pallida]|uniref:Histone deacetylase 10 isoform X2 n=1 Tax=Iris pallida TaxID=29817 RepID=A0AAX6GBY5_IRIPA|nr:histone deacetylase 10 isoform X2 [Iris pallida]